MNTNTSTRRLVSVNTTIGTGAPVYVPAVIVSEGGDFITVQFLRDLGGEDFTAMNMPAANVHHSRVHAR